MSNGLTPYEQRNQYSEIVKISKSAGKQTAAIKNSSDALVEANLKSADEIIASQERTNEILSSGFSDLTYSLDEIAGGINHLGAVFEWGISEVVWQIEQNTAVLRNILKTLESPKGTEANERKKWGDEAYSNGLLDDALEDYLASEKIYKYDFTIYISAGLIYLNHKMDKAKALEYFDKAVKYAGPKSKSHTSFALLCRAVTLFSMGKTGEAELSSQAAINITPDFNEAYYQNAQYNAQLGNFEKCISYLNIVFNKDARYFLKYSHDILFNPARHRVNEMIIKMKNGIYDLSKKQFNLLKQKTDKLNRVIVNYDNLHLKQYNTVSFEKEINRFTDLVRRDSYLDAVETNNFISDFVNIINDEIGKFNYFIEDYINSILREIEDEKSAIGGNIYSSKEKKRGTGFILLCISIFIGIVFGFKGCFGDWGPNGLDVSNHFFSPVWYFIKSVGLGGIIGGIIYFLFSIFGETRLKANEIENSPLINELKTNIKKITKIQDEMKNIHRYP